MANWFNRGKRLLAQGVINWGTTDVRIMLVRSTYVFNPDSNFVSDVVASECNATDYARQALTYPGTPVTQDDAADRARLFANQVTWVGLGGATNNTLGGAIVFVFNAADAAAQLIAFLDTNDLVTADNNVVLTPDATLGLLTIS